jgi:hypothetical protein
VGQEGTKDWQRTAADHLALAVSCPLLAATHTDVSLVSMQHDSNAALQKAQSLGLGDPTESGYPSQPQPATPPPPAPKQAWSSSSVTW